MEAAIALYQGFDARFIDALIAQYNELSKTPEQRLDEYISSYAERIREKRRQQGGHSPLMVQMAQRVGGKVIQINAR